MEHRRCSAGLLLVMLFVGGLVGSPPARAQDADLRTELEALKKRVQTLERELAESRRAAPPAAARDAEALAAPRGSRVQISGYTEIRATNVANTLGDRARTDGDFQVTRFRPRLNYLMDPHFTASLQLNASTRSGAASSVNTRDAFLEYRNTGFSVRAGQQKIPYGFQVYREGDEPRAALERVRVFGLLFPDERDLGLVIATAPRNPRAATFAAGVVNGDGVNRSDGDSDKSVAANVLVPLGRQNVVGASFYTGTTTATAGAQVVSRVKQAYGFEHRFNTGRWSTQLEYLWGRALGADLNGGYGQIAYNAGRAGSFFVRHDLFDPNEDAASDYWKRTSVGWYRDFTRQFRLTGEYDFVTNRATRTSRDDTFGVELQGNF